MRHLQSVIPNFATYRILGGSFLSYRLVFGGLGMKIFHCHQQQAFRRYPPEKFIALVESHGIKCDKWSNLLFFIVLNVSCLFLCGNHADQSLNLELGGLS